MKKERPVVLTSREEAFEAKFRGISGNFGEALLPRRRCFCQIWLVQAKSNHGIASQPYSE